MDSIPPIGLTLRNKCVCILVFTSLLLPTSGLAQQDLAFSNDCELNTPAQCISAIAKDQVGILTSPRRIKVKDLKWILPLAAATGTAYAFDRKTLHQISTSPSEVSDFRTASNFTGIYLPVAGIGAAWVAGTLTHNEHLRETGLLAGETLADTALFTEMLKYATNRVRPTATGLPSEAGEFWPEHYGYPAGDSFPSGHTAYAFAVAHVVADEYPNWEVKLAAYGLAAATGFERLGGREHFPSDVIVGGAAGYLIGGYVYNHHSAEAKKRRLMVNPLVGGGTVGGSVVFSLSRSAAP
jgi:membrane-associated phospholipid phosphatase